MWKWEGRVAGGGVCIFILGGGSKKQVRGTSRSPPVEGGEGEDEATTACLPATDPKTAD